MNKRRRTRQILVGIIFVAPWLFGFLVFTLYPLCSSLWLSFMDYHIISPPSFVGLRNFVDLFHDQVFGTAISNTIFYAVISLPLNLLLGFSLALLLNARVKGLGFFRTVFFFPQVLPLVVMGILWKWILNGDIGILNRLLGLIGIMGPPWLTSPTWVKPAIILTNVFLTGQIMVIFLASLQDVPIDLYEAAELDGANWFGKLSHITLPMITPIILFNVILGLIDVAQVFTLPYILTAPSFGQSGSPGRPGTSALFYTMYMFSKGFSDFDMGYSSAMGWFLFAVVLTLTLIVLQISKRYVFYQGD